MKSNKLNIIIILTLFITSGVIFSAWFLFIDKKKETKADIAVTEEGCGADAEQSGSAGNLTVDLEVPAILTIGNPQASVIIVEFSDFLCPYCKTASELLKSVLTEFKDDVKLVFVNYPLDKECNKKVKIKMHEGACLLAKGAICSSRQNRFSEYYEASFAMDFKNAGMAEMRNLAIVSRLDIPVFMNCLSSPETTSELTKHLKTAYSLNISSIPALFINGQQIPNWNDKTLIVKMIREEIMKKGK